MNRLATYLYQKITGRITILFIMIFLLFTATILPWIARLTTELIGVSESIDTGFQFQLDSIYSIVDSYGEEGRRVYIILRWTFDVVFPLVYAGFLVSITAFLAKRIDCKFKEKILYVAILAMSFDFLENIFATIVMAIYPTRIDFIVYLLITSSILKWGILGLAFLVPILQVFRLGYLSYRKKR